MRIGIVLETETYKTFRTVANSDTLPTTMNWVEASGVALGLDQQLILRLQLVTEELVLNTLRHGCKSRANCRCLVLLDIEITPTGLFLVYTDHAPSFNPLLAPEEVPEPGTVGVGLELIRHLPVRADYHALTATMGNQVKMKFSLQQNNPLTPGHSGPSHKTA